MDRQDHPLMGLSQRLPPSNLQAEQALLGAILANNRAMDRCAGLDTAHFADPIHGRIFLECQKTIQAGSVADAVTLKNRFEHSGILEEVGGTGYLAQLLSSMVGIINAGEYAVAIRDTWVRRQVIDVGETAINNAFGADPDADPASFIAEAVDCLMRLSDAAEPEVAGTWADAVDAAMNAADAASRDEGVTCLNTGIPSLDKLLQGLWPGSLNLLGARDGQGKTGLAMQAVEHIGRQLLADALASGFTLTEDGRAPPLSEHVLIVSLDMSREELATRMLASATGISSNDIRRGNYDADQAALLVQARRDLRSLPLLIEDKAGLTLSQIGLKARVGVKRKRVRLVVVDHMIRVRSDKDKADRPRTEQVDHIAWTFKELAKSLGVPFLVLTQLGRVTDRREGAGSQRPQKSDMMFGGESHADNVMLLWREDTYMGAKPPEPAGRLKEETKSQMISDWWAKKRSLQGKAEVILTKSRFGAIGDVTLTFDGPRTRFGDVPDPTTTDLWNRPPADAVAPDWVTE